MKLSRKENQRLYMELLGLVNDRFPPGFAETVKKARPDLPFNKINNVRYGRSSRMDILLFMIRVLMPGFIVPDKFIEAEKQLNQND